MIREARTPTGQQAIRETIANQLDGVDPSQVELVITEVPITDGGRRRQRRRRRRRRRQLLVNASNNSNNSSSSSSSSSGAVMLRIDYIIRLPDRASAEQVIEKVQEKIVESPADFVADLQTAAPAVFANIDASAVQTTLSAEVEEEVTTIPGVPIEASSSFSSVSPVPEPAGSSGSGETGPSLPLLAGAAGGGGLAVFLLLGIVVYKLRRRQQRRRAKTRGGAIVGVAEEVTNNPVAVAAVADAIAIAETVVDPVTGEPDDSWVDYHAPAVQVIHDNAQSTQMVLYAARAEGKDDDDGEAAIECAGNDNDDGNDEEEKAGHWCPNPGADASSSSSSSRPSSADQDQACEGSEPPGPATKEGDSGESKCAADSSVDRTLNLQVEGSVNDENEGGGHEGEGTIAAGIAARRDHEPAMDELSLCTEEIEITADDAVVVLDDAGSPRDNGNGKQGSVTHPSGDAGFTVTEVVVLDSTTDAAAEAKGGTCVEVWREETDDEEDGGDDGSEDDIVV